MRERCLRGKCWTMLLLALVLAVLAPGLLPGGQVAAQTSRHFQAGPSDEKLTAAMARFPLAFVPNAGQMDAGVRYQAHSHGGTLFFSEESIMLALPLPAPSQDGATDRQHSAPATFQHLRLRFDGANDAASLSAERQLPGIVNYLTGNHPAQWHTNLPTYAALVYHQLYPGIDLRYDGSAGVLKGTYTLAAGADPAQIRWRYEGARDLSIDAGGNLWIGLPAHDTILVEQAPLAWQEIAGTRINVPARYVLDEDGSTAFALGNYDPAYPLTIDPTLLYSTYLGGNYNDEGSAIALDSSGNIYITGQTTSATFPTTPNALQSTLSFSADTAPDAFVTKLNAAGTTILYSTYFGGWDAAYIGTRGSGISVDSGGYASITGMTHSPEIPQVNALPATIPTWYCEDDIPVGGSRPNPVYCNTDLAFAARLNQNGTALVYSTYLNNGKQASGNAIKVDSAGSAYIAGTVTDTCSAPFTCTTSTTGGFTRNHVFVERLSASGGLIYALTLGGNGVDVANAITIDASGNAYLAGDTSSSDFPSAPNVYHGNGDAFAAKLNAAGTALLYSTYLGGSANDAANGIALDSSLNAYLVGTTHSDDFPVANAFQQNNGGSQHSGDVFVTRLSAAGAIAYSTYLGGSGDDQGYGIAVDSQDYAYVTGVTCSTNFPVANALYPTFSAGYSDAFVARLTPGGSALAFSTFLGGSDLDQAYGIAVDSAFRATVVGMTASTNFPILSPVQAANAGGSDVFVATISAPPPGGALTLSSTSLNFGMAPANTDSPLQALVLYSTGTAPLAINGMSTSSSEFSVNNYCPSSLAVDSYCFVSLVFHPSATGARSGILYIDDSAASSPQQVALYGTGTPAPAPDQPALSLALLPRPENRPAGPLSLNFGSQKIYNASNLLAINVKNSGAVDAHIQSVQIQGTNAADFGFADPTGLHGLPATMVPGNVYTINLYARPQATGMRTATLVITGDAVSSPYQITLTAVGTTGVPSNTRTRAMAGGTQQSSPAAQTTPSGISGLSFGGQAVGLTSKPQVVPLANTGDANIQIGGIATTPGSDFSINATTCSTVLDPGQSCVINIVFTPTAAGQRTGTLTINGDGIPATQTLSLSGTGIPPVALPLVTHGTRSGW